MSKQNQQQGILPPEPKLQAPAPPPPVNPVEPEANPAVLQDDPANNEPLNEGENLMAPEAKDQKNEGLDTFVTDVRDELKSQRHFEITIPSTERDRDAVAVQVNGYCYNIPRDKACIVPEAVVQILKNAVITEYSTRKREGDQEGNELVPREVQRFAFSSNPVK